MRFLIDENTSAPRLAARLQVQGHQPILAQDVGLLSASDPRVLIWAIAHALPVLTRDNKDFEDLHDLLMAAGGHHPGLLVVCFDDDPRHNLSDRAIATAISKLESSGVPIADQLHVLNHWR
jgi:predicted nuclease of predicted toxin-antitoxin system